MLKFLPKPLGEVCPYFFVFNFIFINRFFLICLGAGGIISFPPTSCVYLCSISSSILTEELAYFYFKKNIFLFFIEIQNEVSLNRSAWLMESWFLAEMQKKKKKKNSIAIYAFLFNLLNIFQKCLSITPKCTVCTKKV